ncbi:MAG: transposase [Chitinophagales bacterium]
MREGTLYHLYNRGNNKEQIFFNEENYFYFLHLFKKYLNDYLDMFSYCLMPNHFHFFVRINEVDSEILREAFRVFFMTYSKAINKQQNRTGSLFQKKFKRKEIADQDYYSAIIAYIHYNPIKAGLCYRFEDWKFSSYNAIISDKPTMVQKNEVLEWFSGIEAFIQFHEDYRGYQDDKLKDILF